METLQCLEPLLACAADTSTHVASALIMIGVVVGWARLIFKPLQPLLQGWVEKTEVSWDNKALAYLSWFLDYAFSLKVLQKKEDA